MIAVKNREEFLKQLAALLPSYCTGAEIGVLNGDFSEMILNIINPKHLILVDPYITNNVHYSSDTFSLTTAYSTEEEYEKLLFRFSKEIESGVVAILRKFSYDAVGIFDDNRFDFIYIDGSHRYGDVKKDLEQWVTHLKTDGCICGHDYVDYPDFGVIQAVDEFIKGQGYEMILFNEDGGDWALKKKQ